LKLEGLDRGPDSGLASVMPAAKLSETERFSLALLLELEDDFPGCLDEMAASLPATSTLRRFLEKVLEPAASKDQAA